MLYAIEIPSPVGTLYLGLTGSAVREIRFSPIPNGIPIPSGSPAQALSERLIEQLDAYFSGRLVAFDLPLDLVGTEYQMRVWNSLIEIPYGQTIRYAELARRNGSGARAVGQAIHYNPISIIVPCHRVVGSDGALTGYAGGLPRKQWLLEHEQRRPVSHGH